MKIYLIKKVSQKNGKDPFTYFQLTADLGQFKQVLTMDRDTIANFLDVSSAKLYAMCSVVDKEVLVGTFTKTESK